MITKKTELLVNSYAKVTEMVQEKVQPKLAENKPFAICIRRVNNHSKKKGAVAFQVEYIEKKAPRTRTASRGVNMSVLFNQQYDDRFSASINAHRAWATYTSFESLALALGMEDAFTKEQKETLMELEITNEGREGDRVLLMKPLETVEVNEVAFDFHIGITEVRESDLEDARLSKSQRQSLEHDNAVLRTGGKDDELIVCADTGERVLRITEIFAVPAGESVSDEFDIYVPNKMTESAYKKLNKGKAIKVQDVEDDEEYDESDFDEIITKKSRR